MKYSLRCNDSPFDMCFEIQLPVKPYSEPSYQDFWLNDCAVGEYDWRIYIRSPGVEMDKLGFGIVKGDGICSGPFEGARSHLTEFPTVGCFVVASFHKGDIINVAG